MKHQNLTIKQAILLFLSLIKHFVWSNFVQNIIYNVWCETDGEKEGKGPNEDVGIEGNSGSDGSSFSS